MSANNTRPRKVKEPPLSPLERAPDPKFKTFLEMLPQGWTCANKGDCYLFKRPITIRVEKIRFGRKLIKAEALLTYITNNRSSIRDQLLAETKTSSIEYLITALKTEEWLPYLDWPVTLLLFFDTDGSALFFKKAHLQYEGKPLLWYHHTPEGSLCLGAMAEVLKDKSFFSFKEIEEKILNSILPLFNYININSIATPVIEEPEFTPLSAALILLIKNFLPEKVINSFCREEKPWEAEDNEPPAWGD